MTAAPETALIAGLSVLLAAASAAAGALWRRARPRPDASDGLARLASELAERQRALEERFGRLEAKVGGRSAPAPRIDRPSPPPGPVAGPTLIAVPDLAAGPVEPSAASVELGRRFGAIWDLAESGETPEAIAGRTGYPIGQVELILGLRRQLAAAEGRP